MVLGGQGFWSFSPPQGRRWLERAIEIGRTAEAFEEGRPEGRENLGRALGALGSVGLAQGRHEEGAAAGAEAVSILRPLGESQPLAYALASYAFNLSFLGRLDEAYEAGEEAREMARGLGDGVSQSNALGALGLATLVSGDFEKTQEYLKEAKALIEELGSSLVGPQNLFVEGKLLALMGDLEGAEAIYREADQGFQELGDSTLRIITRSELAHTLRSQGKWEQALPLYRETIRYFQDMGHEPAVANQLECFAYITIAHEEPEKAARLLGAAQAIRERTNNPINIPWEKADYDQAMKHLAKILGSADRDAAVGEGRSMTLDEAVILARTVTDA
jgi:tetratricopeptide (TPR) repeat protein